MAVPVQAGNKAADRSGKLGVARVPVSLFGAPRRLPGFAYRDGSEGKVRGEARTCPGRRQRAGHFALIAAPAGIKESFQAMRALRPPTRLAARAVICAEAEIGGERHFLAAGAGGAKRLRCRDAGALHELFPALRPAVAGAEPADNPVLRLLAEGNARIARPAAHRPVAIEGPLQAGFFMRVDCGEAILPVKRREHAEGVARADDEARAARLQGRVQLRQGLAHEIELPAGMFRQRPISRLKNVERYDRRPGGGRGRKGRMVMDPQVPLEPDDVDTGHRTKIEQIASAGKPRRYSAVKLVRPTIVALMK